MRRALGLVALIGLGVLLGFLVRLIWPREDATPVYVLPPVSDGTFGAGTVSDSSVSAARTVG